MMTTWLCRGTFALAAQGPWRSASRHPAMPLERPQWAATGSNKGPAEKRRAVEVKDKLKLLVERGPDKMKQTIALLLRRPGEEQEPAIPRMPDKRRQPPSCANLAGSADPKPWRPNKVHVERATRDGRAEA